MARRLQAMRAPGYEQGFEFRTLPERLDAPRRIKKPTTGRIAVKVINHLGDEVMKVFRVN